MKSKQLIPKYLNSRKEELAEFLNEEYSSSDDDAPMTGSLARGSLNKNQKCYNTNINNTLTSGQCTDRESKFSQDLQTLV